jgi:hypothetical protein
VHDFQKARSCPDVGAPLIALQRSFSSAAGIELVLAIKRRATSIFVGEKLKMLLFTCSIGVARFTLAFGALGSRKPVLMRFLDPIHRGALLLDHPAAVGPIEGTGGAESRPGFFFGPCLILTTVALQGGIKRSRFGTIQLGAAPRMGHESNNSLFVCRCARQLGNELGTFRIPGLHRTTIVSGVTLAPIAFHLCRDRAEFRLRFAINPLASRCSLVTSAQDSRKATNSCFQCLSG